MRPLHTAAGGVALLLSGIGLSILAYWSADMLLYGWSAYSTLNAVSWCLIGGGLWKLYEVRRSRDKWPGNAG